MPYKLAGIVTLFNPAENVVENIASYFSHLSCLYVVDNSAIPHMDLNKYFDPEKIIYLHANGENIGLAKAMNSALKEAADRGFQYLLTMDQDTVFPEGIFQSFWQCTRDLAAQGDNIALFSPLHNKKFHTGNMPCHYHSNKIVMSSANIVNIQIAQKIGGFDENLFIDEIDHEFCMRIITHGYQTVCFDSLYVFHTLGVSILSGRKKITLYPASRIYYMVRNFFYVKKKYANFFTFFIRERKKYLIKFIVRHLLYSHERIAILKALYQALVDAQKNKYGKKESNHG